MVSQATCLQERVGCLPRPGHDRSNHASHQSLLVWMDCSGRYSLDRPDPRRSPLWCFHDAPILWDERIPEFAIQAICGERFCGKLMDAILFCGRLPSLCNPKYVPISFACVDGLVIRAIGIGFSMTVMGCVAILLVPIPFLFYRYGEALRVRSPYLNPNSGKSIV